jgi:hypothetical protein
MRNRKHITCLAIPWIVNKKFAHEKDAENSYILCHCTFKYHVIGEKANVFTSMRAKFLRNSKTSFKMAKNIQEFTASYFKIGTIDICRAFILRCVICHFFIIPQNFMDCKHNLKKRLKKASEKIYEYMG